MRGGVDGETYGNGLSNDRFYSAVTGRLRRATIDAGRITSAPFSVQDLAYTYDAMGNVTSRVDSAPDALRSEYFSDVSGNDGYDGLDRLLVHRIAGGATVTVSYNANGNIANKSDVGNYTYAGYGPHAVSTAGTRTYTYDANGNMLTATGGRGYQWASFNQVKTITDSTANKSADFYFGAGHERVRQVRKSGGNVTDTTIYVGALFEKVTTTAGTLVEYKHYIMAPTGRIGVVTQSTANGVIQANTTRYFHTDGLGSITVVSDEQGRVLKRYAYDAWGKQSTLYTNNGSGIVNQAPTTRGFTDHEMLGDFGLIHMNGRVYDPVLGRFLSADPSVDGVYDSQGYNRYSYVGNNPLNHTDPSGYFKLGDALKIVAVIAISVVTAGAALYAYAATFTVGFGSLGGAISAIATGGFITAGEAIVAGAAAGFASGFAGSLLNGGSIGDAFKVGVIGGAIGGVTGGLTYGIGNVAGEHSWNWGETALAHGTVQGAATEATGGQFRHGFYAGFASSALSPQIQGVSDYRPVQAVAAAVVGGTASSLGGGKFANGAVSGAFTYLFNWASHVNNVHHTANVKALGGALSREEIEILRRVTVEADADQAVENQYRHAMRDLDHAQTVDQARALANAYVRERFNNAMDLLKTGDRAGALREFGFALHTIQDSTSPSHQGFQGWCQAWTDHPYTTAEVRAHAGAELTYPGNNSALFRATQGAYQWFQSGKVPDGDLFNIYGHD